MPPAVLGIAAIAAAAALAPHAGYAQTPPDAGALQQQIDRERAAQPLPPRAAPDRRPEPPPMPPGDGVTVTVREFRFAGNRLLGAEQLAPAVSGYLNRPLDFAQLQAATAAVAALYREAGWVVRAYLPAQNIREGIITVQVVEATVGQLRLQGDGPHVPAQQVRRIFEQRLHPGEPLNSDAVDRAQLLADDLPGVKVTGSLQPGAAMGETDLLLTLTPEPLFFGDASWDNSGARSTGRERLAANLGLNSPLGRGDALLLSVLHSRGSDYGRLAGSWPVGPDGGRIGLNASQLKYRLVGDDFAALDAQGQSTSAGLEASYPLLRTRMHNLLLTVSHDRKRFDNASAGVTTTRYRLNASTAMLNGNLFDNAGGGGANTATLAYVNGLADLGGSPNEAQDAATTRTAGHYSKLHYAVARQQTLTERVAAFVQYGGQWASKNLDSAEKFYLGGTSGVRAYPANEGAGANGGLLNLEVRWRLPHGVALAAFRDSGWVKVNRDNQFAGAPTLNRYRLQGHGVSAVWQPTGNVNVKLTWARRESANPNATATGRDQDGTLREHRLWAAASVAF